MESLFKIAEASAQGILIFMGILSIVSVAIMIERYFFLKKIGSSSQEMAGEFRKVIEGKNIGGMEELSRSATSLEGRALGYGLSFVKEHGENGLDELFNSFKTIEKPTLEKNLNLLGTIASNA